MCKPVYYKDRTWSQLHGSDTKILFHSPCPAAFSESCSNCQYLLYKNLSNCKHCLNTFVITSQRRHALSKISKYYYTAIVLINFPKFNAAVSCIQASYCAVCTAREWGRIWRGERVLKNCFGPEWVSYLGLFSIPNAGYFSEFGIYLLQSLGQYLFFVA